MNSATNFRLSVMMFLEYVIWGAWLPLSYTYLPKHLGLTDSQVGWVQNTFPIASLLTILIGGQIADRFFSAEKVLGVCHLLGGLFIAMLPFVDRISDATLSSVHFGSMLSYLDFDITRVFLASFLLMLGHFLFYAPTMALTNSITFAHIDDPAKFGKIRLWGTIGWIAASVPMILLLDNGYRASLFALPAITFKDYGLIYFVAAAASFALAGWSLLLPHTPPKPQTAERTEGDVSVLSLLSHPVILVLFVATFLDMIVHTGFYFFAARFLEAQGVPGKWVMPALSIGQVAEIGTMAVLATVLKRLGWKTTMTLGILGHALRFGVFWFADGLQNTMWLVLLINVLHGVCYAFYFATVFIFIDEYFPAAARTKAQGLFNVAVLGVGQLIGNVVWGGVGNAHTVRTVQDGKEVSTLLFGQVFGILTYTALATAVFFLVCFWPDKRVERPTTAPAPAS